MSQQLEDNHLPEIPETPEIPEIPQVPKTQGYRKIEPGETNWTEPLHDNFQHVLDKIEDDGKSKQQIEQIDRNTDIKIKELENRITAHLGQMIRRDEFDDSQRRQDNRIAALNQGMDTGFVGTSVVFSFSEDEIQHWKGYDGGLVEGAVNASDQLSS